MKTPDLIWDPTQITEDYRMECQSESCPADSSVLADLHAQEWEALVGEFDDAVGLVGTWNVAFTRRAANGFLEQAEDLVMHSHSGRDLLAQQQILSLCSNHACIFVS